MKAQKLVLLSVLLFFLFSCVKIGTRDPLALETGKTPFSVNGSLRVIGTQLSNQAGSPIQLRGISTHGLQWYPWGHCIKKESLASLANDWGIDILRIGMYVDSGGYNTNPAHFRAMVDTIVEETLKLGIYVILDWHILVPGDPWVNIEGARGFFEYMARKHGDKGNVLYELCNEPNSGVTWDRIKLYAEDLIPRIRKHDSTGIIIVGTPGWSSLGLSADGDPADIISNPISRDNSLNVMYSFHFYAASHGKRYRQAVRSASQLIPIFVTEWGTSSAEQGDGPLDRDSSVAWIKLMSERNLSWVYWNFADDKRSSSVLIPGACPKGPWTGSTLKESGRWVMEWMNAPVEEFYKTNKLH